MTGKKTFLQLPSGRNRHPCDSNPDRLGKSAFRFFNPVSRDLWIVCPLMSKNYSANAKTNFPAQSVIKLFIDLESAVTGLEKADNLFGRRHTGIDIGFFGLGAHLFRGKEKSSGIF